MPVAFEMHSASEDAHSVISMMFPNVSSFTNSIDGSTAGGYSQTGYLGPRSLSRFLGDGGGLQFKVVLQGDGGRFGAVSGV